MVFNLRTSSSAESVEDNPTSPKSFSLEELQVATRTSSSAESIEDNPTRPKSFSLEELRAATRNFSKDNIVGEGIVYRGRLADGSLVAVKRVHCAHPWSEEEVEAGVQVGSTVSMHPNVLPLRGFCRTETEHLLVYPFMVNNTLSYNLRERPDRFARPLDWTTRKRIALGVARGLAHLHNHGNIKIMHGYIEASNILLNVDFEAMIGGFSGAVIMHEDVSVITRTVWSGYGLIAPEFILTGMCTLKNDVFAYGRMLLELISGQSIFELCQFKYNEKFSLDEWLGDLLSKDELGRMIDPNLQGNYVEEEAERLVWLALSCAHKDPLVRPEMSEVVRMLENQFLQRDPSSRSSWSQSECDSTPYYSFPPSPSPSPSPSLGIAP